MAWAVEDEFDWKEYALCFGMAYLFSPDDNPFFAEGYGATYKVARPYCASCPVVVDCLLDVIDDRGAIGFRGATTPNERASIRRHLDNVVDFVTAVERIWKKNRSKGIPVPPKSIWSDWDT